jgi:hypothetical protein
MPFAVVIVETTFGERHELALALDVPSRDLAAKIMRDLGKPFRPGDTFQLFIQTPHGDKPIPPFVTLAELGVTDGQRLRLRRETGAIRAEPPAAHAHLRTQSGVMLPLEGNNIIIGRKDAVLQVPLDLDLARYDPGHAVSRRHACIEYQAGSYYLLDLQSTNGTRLNGEPVIPGRKMPLQDGAVIEFGLGVRLTFVAAKPGTGEPR